MNDKQIFNLISLLEPVQESEFSRVLILDHGRLRSRLNKMMLDGRVVRNYKNKNVFYATRNGFTSRIRIVYTLPEIKRKIKSLIERNPGKNIMYYSDKLTMEGIGNGYDSNQKLIRRMGEKGILDLRIKGSNTLCYPNYPYRDVEGHYGSIGIVTIPDNSFTIRSDVTIESFVRQMAKLSRKYPDVKKFKLVPVEE